MQADPNLEWQRLTEHYRQMGDERIAASWPMTLAI